MSKKVLRKITKNYANIKKEVGEVMGGRILNHEAKHFLNTGVVQGELRAKTESLIEVLECLGTIPEILYRKIEAERDLETIKKWFKIALRAESVEQFIETMDK